MSGFFIIGYGCPATADHVSLPHAEHTQTRLATIPGRIEWTTSPHRERVAKQSRARNEMARRFGELRKLVDGWFDGKGLAPDGEKLDIIEARMLADYPSHLPVPAIVPTPEGNLLFEWSVPGDPSVDIQFSDLKADFHAFRPDMTDLEREFDLSSEEEWVHFLAFLSETVGITAP